MAVREPEKPIVKNLVKECIDSNSVHACLNQYFNVNEKLLNELPRSLLPDIVEKPCRSLLQSGLTDKARTELVDHIRNFYTVENLKHFCSELRRIAKMGFYTYTDVAKAIEKYLRWSPPSEEGATPPAVHGKSKKSFKPSFIIMTANENEFEAACHFLQWPDEKVKFFNEKMRQNVSFGGDPSLRRQVKEIKAVPGETYKVFSVGEKQGILMRCTNMGSFTREGSNWHTFKLLRDAKENGWPLEAILIVGCCGARSADSRVPEGTILVAEHINQYLIGKIEKGGIHYKPLSHSTSKNWTGFIEQNKAPQSAEMTRHISELHKSIMFSGDFVVKDVPTAEQLRGDQRPVGFEMEGLGVISAVDVFKEFFSAGFKCPDVVLVKGVSDNAGEDKNDRKNTIFFSEKVLNVDEKTRQHMCTVMSLTLVLRAIIEKWGSVDKFVL